jgi:hypothetical protein
MESFEDEDERIKHAIHAVFDEFTIQIKVKYRNPSTYEINILLERCLLTEILISDETLFIAQLHKCNDVSGSIILEKIESFARTIGVKTISLNDASNIIIEECNVKISLQSLYLLTAGLSWYNSKGYVDTNPELKYTAKIRSDEIKVSMVIFIKRMITALNENQYYELYHANGNAFKDAEDPTNFVYLLLTYITDIEPRLHIDLLVKDYFAIVKTLLKRPNPTKNDCSLFKYFEVLFMYIDESYLLARDLSGSTKNLAGKRRKSCKRCLKNKKHRSKHNKNRSIQKGKRKRGRLILTFNLKDIK